MRRKGAEKGCKSGFRALARWGASPQGSGGTAVCASGRFVLTHAMEIGLFVPRHATALPYHARASLSPCFRGVSEWLQIVDESDS
nr:hypothetical protein RVX_1337 [Nitratidesulfovibrio sp. HK-II]